MPTTEDGHTRADILITGESPFNRLNIGQLYEQFINAAAAEIIYRIKEAGYDESKANETFATIIDFINDVRPVYAEFLKSKLRTPDAIAEYVEDVLHEGLHLIIPQFCDNITPQMVLHIAKKWHIKRQRVTYRKTLPSGEKITIKTKHKALIGSKYLFLLGKIPMDQLNCIEFGYTNQFRTPIKPSSKSSVTAVPFGQTPIRLGEDEISHQTYSVGTESTARFMGLYANSPAAITLLQKHLLMDQYPTRLGRVEMTTDEIIRSSSNTSLFRHQLAAVGFELKTVKSSVDNPGIQPAPVRPTISTKLIERGVSSCALNLKTPLIENNSPSKYFDTVKLDLNDYGKPFFFDEMAHINWMYGYVELVLADSTIIKLPKRLALLNILFWEPMMHFGVQPTSKDIFNIKYVTSDSIHNILSRVYERLLDARPDVPYLEFIEQLWLNINRLYQFIWIFLGQYLASMDVLGLSLLMNQPPLKKLADYVYDPKQGTKVAETIQKAHNKELLNLISSPDTIEDNILLPFVESGILKKNQIPQALLCYGCRSDVDDTMVQWIISRSSLSGLRNERDFATESLSAKKALYFSRDGIKQSQYWARKMRLACSLQQYIFPGSCGSTSTIPLMLQSSWAKNYIHRIIEVNGKPIELTGANLHEFVDKQVNLVSPFCCHYTNGVCERCAGYGRNRLSKYMPPNIHIGLLSSTKISSVVSQKVLSAKHLIHTDSKLYNLPQMAQKYFVRQGDCIFWDPQWAKQLKQLAIRIPTDAINPVTDLNMETLPAAETFSKLSYVELLRNGEVCDTIQLEADLFIPYLSEAALEYMRSVYNQLVVDDTSVTVPLAGFNFNREFMKYVILNDDMITYTKRVEKFLSKQIVNYTSIPAAISDFATLVYSKSETNSFFLEMALRAFLIQDVNMFWIPIVTDPNHVHFENLDRIISESSISGKLGFERLGAWLQDPATALYAKPQGLFSRYFGLQNNA